MICACSLALVLTTSCSSTKTDDWFVTHNGNMPTEERIAKVGVGASQDEVRQVLGAPSTVVSFDKNTWIYMSSDVKRVAFFAPEEINRDVLTIRFNDVNKVSEISRLGKAQGQEIAVNEDKTEALGQEQGFFSKFFGGVGQYNPFMGGQQSRL